MEWNATFLFLTFGEENSVLYIGFIMWLYLIFSAVSRPTTEGREKSDMENFIVDCFT
jgi:hypothetical protein